MNLAVRTTGDPLALAGPVRAQVRALTPEIPVAHLRTMDDTVGSSLARQRSSMLVLAVLEIYGVIAQRVAARRQEFGVRAALGASPRALVWISLLDGMRQTGAGLALGALAALILTRVMQGILYRVTTTDPVTFAATLVITGAVATVASYLPAKRAGRVDPASALGAD